MVKWVDTHCHLQDAQFDVDREGVLARALAQLDFLVVIGDDADSSRAALSLTRQNVYAAVGVHPYHAESVNTDCLTQLADWAQQPFCVAIGETGLDYARATSSPASQREAFLKQIELAATLKKTLVVHNREADADTFALLSEYAAEVPAVILHCFGSNAAFAEVCAAKGFYISFAGNVTFPKAQSLREALQVVPLDRLLLETDAPYLAPQPVRGKRCEPVHVTLTGESVAAYLGISAEDLAEQIVQNARLAYGLTKEITSAGAIRAS